MYTVLDFIQISQILLHLQIINELARVTWAISAEIVQSVQRVATSWKTGGVGVRVSEGSGMLSFPGHPDRFWGSPSVISDGYRELFRPGWGGGGTATGA
jgi:hypothetical protein